MSINRFGVATALAVGGFLAAPAMGGITGMSYDYVSSSLSGGGDYWTVRVYADLTPGARVDAVAGNSQQSKIVSTSGTFYQNVNAGPTSKDLNCNFFGFDPDMEWDSFVTIGCLCADGTPFGNNNLNNIGIEWDAFEDFGGTINSSNGTWFVTVDDQQGEEQGGRVLIGQFTILGDSSTSMTFEALFQGREAGGSISWGPDLASIIIPAPAGPADCNDNGVEDADDIADGTSQDCNGNAVPDECDIESGSSNDCDNNGTPDECQGDDCDGNGVPDACDLAGGAADCDNNCVLDSCDLDNGGADCNSNGVPDTCDIAGGSSEDCDGDGTPDECETDSDGDGTIDDCEYVAYLNVNTQEEFDTAFDAVMGSSSGDMIIADEDAFNGEAAVDYMGKSLYMSVDSNVNTNGSVTLGPGSYLTTTSSDNMVFNGTLTGPPSGNASVGGAVDDILTGDFSILRVRPNTSLDMMVFNALLGYVTLNGETLVMNGASLYTNGQLITNGSFSTMRDSSVTAEAMINELLVTAQGTYNTDLDNYGTFKCSGDTVLTGDLFNTQLISVNVGTMYCLGNVDNLGTIIGDFDPGPPFRGGSEPGSGDGMNISGNYVTGPDASLTFAHENWKLSVGGHFDVAINDSTKFNMGLATIRMYESGSGISTMEAMSQDLGETFDGLDSSIVDNFPLGTLEINGHVMVVDDRTNTENGDEIVYVQTLVVEAGATFDANGRMVWCEEIINNGTILGDVEVIDPEVPCDGNINGDDVVNIDDLLIILSDWGGTGGDANGDGQTNIDDILVVLGNWGACS